MVTGSEIMAAYQGLKAGFDILQRLNAASKEAAINEVKVTLGRHILDAQQALTAANAAQADTAETIRQLEQKIVQLENWEADKQRYVLTDTGRGTLAYRLKEGMENGEPAHWLCPNCYQQGKKSILKHEFIATGRVQTLVCHPCGMDILVEGLRNDRSLSGSKIGRR